MATEKRLIDANALEKALETVNIRIAPDKGKMFNLIENAPTVDAVEVVRCKNCKRWNEEIAFCDEHSHFFEQGMCWDMFNEDDFCSRGERKTDGKE